jgi:hypothetical protein
VERELTVVEEMHPARPGRRFLQFTLKTLLFLVLLVACSLSAYRMGQDAGRREAQEEIDRLNEECADMMHRADWSSTAHPVGEPPPPRSYDFRDPKDREAWREMYKGPFDF